MSDALVLATPWALSHELAVEADQAKAYAAACYATNTRRAYASRWKGFCRWCVERELEPLPASPDAVAAHLAWLAQQGRKAATLDQTLVAIGQAHKLAALPSPCEDGRVQAVRKGIRRTIGTAQRQKAPLLGAELREAVAGPASPRKGELAALRDRALLLLGWYGALRRSELVAIEVPDVRVVPQGLEVRLGRSKTDQEGHGRTIPYPRARTPELCPVHVVRAWLAAAAITEGPVLRQVDRWGRVGVGRLSGASVARIVKAYAVAAGLDAELFAGHSLRAGLVTEAARSGRSEAAIMRITGHQSSAMVRRYIRDADLHRNVASAGLLDV